MYIGTTMRNAKKTRYVIAMHYSRRKRVYIEMMEIKRISTAAALVTQ